MIPPARPTRGRYAAAPTKNQTKPSKAAVVSSAAAQLRADMPDTHQPIFEPLMTVDEVAGVIRLSPRQVRRMIASGELPVVHFGRLVRIRPSDLAALLKDG